MDCENIFVTVGTTQFDNLIRAVTQPETVEVLKRRGCTNILLQIGNGSYIPDGEICGVRVSYYRYKPSIQADLLWADFVISHAGAASCIETLELEKPLLAVINENLMDNHQIEVAQKLSESRFLLFATCDNLNQVLDKLDFSLLKTYPKRDPRKFINAIDTIMGFK